MLKSGLQEHILKTRTIDGKIQVWDILRKKYVRLTPEENVRQTFINYLVEKKSRDGGTRILCPVKGCGFVKGDDDA